MKSLFRARSWALTSALIPILYLTSSIAISNTQHKYKVVNFSQLNGWNHGDQSNTITALKASCKKMLYAKSKSTNDKVWDKVCQFIIKLPKDISNQQARRNLTQFFTPYQVTFQGSNNGLFTG